MGTTALTGAWLLFFYTNFCHLSAVEAASIFAIARVFDAIASPLMGYITDNFGHTFLGKKFGRRKFFILSGIPAVFSYCFIWVSDMGYLYYLLTYLVFELVYSMVLVPYETLVPEMTDDFKKKPASQGRESLSPSCRTSSRPTCRPCFLAGMEKITPTPSFMPDW
jgi:oligogalacturonide transporter